MNDNNSSDRLTVMSYCAEFDMGRRIQGWSGKYKKVGRRKLKSLQNRGQAEIKIFLCADYFAESEF